MDQLEQQMAPLQQQKNAQMEALHIRMNTPYEASEVQNYADALVAEQHRLDVINGRITAGIRNMKILCCCRHKNIFFVSAK